MRFVVVVVAVVVVVCGEAVVGKVFTKCELATELETRFNMAREDIKKWVCIAKHESTYNTAAINHRNWDGSKDYGLFQLNNKYWCDAHYEKSECGMPCSDLLDDDIANDLECIKKIIRDTERWKGKGKGLTAWVAYVNSCQNRNLDEFMAECWTDAISSNQISPGNIRPAQESPPTSQGHEPIINNARTPIRPKVISNMHPPYPMYPSYMRVPMVNRYVVPRHHHFFYQRNY